MFGGVGFRQDISKFVLDNDVYRLDLTTMKWSVETSDRRPQTSITATGTILLDSVLIVYGGILYQKSNMDLEVPHVYIVISTDTWFYYNRVKQWFQYSPEKCKPPARMLHAAVATNTQTMMVYGGMVWNSSQDKTVILRDLWSLMLPSLDNSNDSILGESLISTSTWRCVDQLGPNT